MNSRRDVLKTMALGIGLAVPAGLALKRSQVSTTPAAEPNNQKQLAVAKVETPAPWQLFAPFQRGQEISHGWAITGLTGAIAGAFNLRLSNVDGRTSVVHVCLKDEFSSGIAQSELFDLVLQNGGAANVPSDEKLAQTLQALATSMRDNELSISSSMVAGLMSHEDRVARYANDPEFQGVLV